MALETHIPVTAEEEEAWAAALPQDLQTMFKEAGAAKFDDSKIPLQLLPREGIEQIATVLGFGAQKYAAHNWRQGMDWSRLVGAALRHLTAFNDGEDLDPESGLSHIAHAGCCVMFLLQYIKDHPELDDRYKSTEDC